MLQSTGTLFAPVGNPGLTVTPQGIVGTHGNREVRRGYSTDCSWERTAAA